MQQTQKKSLPSITKMGYIIILYTFASGFTLTMVYNYSSYAYTDLAHIDPAVMATCMAVSNIISTIISLFSGAIVAKTRSRLGQYRFWLLLGPVICLTGGFMLFLDIGQSMIVRAVIMTIGYLMANSTMDFIGTSQPGLYGKIAGTDNYARNVLMARSWQGGSVCQIVGGFVVIPLVTILGAGNERIGFLLTQGIFTVVVMLGSLMLVNTAEPFDPDNKKEHASQEESVRFSEMIKAVLTNRLAIAVVVSDIVRFAGYYVLWTLMVYQCNSVIGSLMAMSYVLSSSSFFALVGSTIAPAVCAKLGGRKKTAIVFGTLTGLAYGSISILGKTTWGFVFSVSLALFFSSFLDTVDMNLYLDAGEYWLNKTGKDTRPYLLSMYSVAIKSSMALSSVILGFVLKAIHYEPGVLLQGSAATTLTMITGLAPAIGYLLPLAVMLLHNVSDKEMEQIIKDNAEKYDA